MLTVTLNSCLKLQLETTSKCGPNVLFLCRMKKKLFTGLSNREDFKRCCCTPVYVSAESEKELQTKSNKCLWKIRGKSDNELVIKIMSFPKCLLLLIKIPKCFSLSACLWALLPWLKIWHWQGSEMKGLFFVFSNYYTNILPSLPHKGILEEKFWFLRKKQASTNLGTVSLNSSLLLVTWQIISSVKYKM